MKKVRSKFVFILNHLCLTGVTALGLISIIATGGGGGDSGDPCMGPVPCLTEDFEYTFYEFVDQLGDPAFVLSDGVVVVFGGIYYDPGGDYFPIAIAGPVVSCHKGDLIEGAIDWNWNGIIDSGEWLNPMDGGLLICNDTLSIYDLFLLGESWHDYEAAYVGASTLNEGPMAHEETDFPKNLMHELIRIQSAE